MAIARYLVFIVSLFSATYAAATYDAKMKGDAPPALGVAYMPSLAITEIDVNRFVRQVRLSLEELRLEEFWGAVLERVHTLSDAARRETR